MKELLSNKLHQYIGENNPDLLLSLQEKNSVTSYISDKVSEINELITELGKLNTPAYIIEEVCMNALTKYLRPSKYSYIVSILQEDFEYAFYNLQKSGTLLYEAVNIITECDEFFKEYNFSEEAEDSRQLRYAITGIINEYLSK